MGIGVEFSGLEQLVKANKLFENFRANAMKMRHVTSNVTTNVSGLDRMKQLFQYRSKIGQPMHANVDVHANDQGLNDLTHKMYSLQGWLNKAHDFKINANDSDIQKTEQDLDNIKNRISSMRKGFTGTGNGLKDSIGPASRLGSELGRDRTKAITLKDGVSRVGSAFKGAFAGGMVASGIQHAWSGLKTVVTQGNALVMAGNKAKVAWKNIGLSHGQGNAMADQMENIGQMTNMSDDDITKMQRSFYSLTDSAPKARSLTNEIVSFGKASGDSNAEITRMGRTLPRVLASNKINASMFNRTFRQSPKLMDGIIKASGKSSASFKQMLGAGKLTSQQLQGYMAKAAKGSGQAWSEYTNTFGGRVAAMKKTWATAEKGFAKPFTNGLTKSMGALGGKNGSLTKVERTVTKISAALGKKVGNYIGKAIGFLIKNQKSIFRVGTALMRIAGIVGKTVFKTIASMFGAWGKNSRNASSGIQRLANGLTTLSHHTRLVATVTRTLMALWAVTKIAKIARAFKTMNSVLRMTAIRTKALAVVKGVVTGFKRFTFALRSGATAQKALNFAMKANPLGMIITAVGLVAVGLVELYKHCATFRRGVQAAGRFGVKAFKALWNGVKALSKLLWALFKKSPLYHALKLAMKVGGKAFHFLGNAAHGMCHKAGHFIGGLTKKISGSGKSASRSTSRSAAKSSKSVHGYLSKSGKYYSHYHKGLRKMSSASYKAQQRMRSRYAKRSKASLKKYEGSYRRYEKKRSSLSRKYGKVRAMYSAKSLKTIEKRFRRLRKTIMKYAKGMFTGTRKWFRKIGSGAGKQFRGIYKSARRWIGRATRTQRRDYRTMNRNSRRLLDGSVKRYVRILRMRFKKQRYYDRQLIKQTKRTNTIMRKLPLGWVKNETKQLIANWRRQRSSYITHNERMTHALVTHIHTMSHHFRNFKDSTEDIFDDLEDNVEKSFTRFFDKLHDIAGHGMNEVQSPLNTGAQHLNGFVSAFGETSAPLKSMPAVSYATGTGALSGISSIRRPITRLTSAILNDDSNNGQETVVHPNGSVDQPHGANVHTTLAPGDEVLNATETHLMEAINKPVHLANGTGLFASIKNALSGGSHGSVSQASLYSQAKDTGKHKLLNEMENVMKSPSKVLSGMFGAAPSDQKGVIGDVTSGIYGLGGSQAGSWWNTLLGLVKQTLDDGGSSSDILNYAIKNWMGVPYVYGATAHSGADCGGAVQSILSHFGIDISHTNMEDSPAVRYVGKDAGSAHPGDLVMFGGSNHSGPNSHVGIYAGHGKMWNETPPKSTISDVSTGYGDGFNGYYRIKNAPQNNSDPLKDVKTNSTLGGFIKRQESPMLKWISKNLEPLLDFSDISGTAGAWTKDGTQAHHIAEDVFEAAEHLGMDAKHAAAVVGNAWHESAGFEHGLKVNQFGGGGGKGLFQFTGQGSRYGWSPMGQVKSIMANALGSSASSWEHSGGSPASLAHSFETIFERGSIPAFAARDSAAERAYLMFGGGGSHFARGGHIKPGQIATVGERGAELFQAGSSGGTIIPHEASKRILNRTNKPVNVHQDIHIDVKDGNADSGKKIVRTLDQYMSALGDKFNQGGALNV